MSAETINNKPGS